MVATRRHLPQARLHVQGRFPTLSRTGRHIPRFRSRLLFVTKDTTIRGKVLQGIYWSLSAKIAIQLFSWGVTFLVIRLLDPSDYGLAAMGEVVFGFLFMVTAEGMFSAIVQSREIDERKLRQMFGVLLAINVALFAVQYLSAPLLARYYNEPRIVPLLQMLATAFLFIPFSAVPASFLDRALDVRRRALVEMGTQLASGILVLCLALTGFGVWALISGVVARFAFRAILLNIVAPWFGWPIFSLRGVEKLVWFGSFMTLNHIVWFVYSRVDVFMGGRSLSARELGFYTVAAHLASLPMGKIVQTLNEVAFPAYSRIQDEPAQVQRYLLKSLRLVTLVTLPMFMGLATIADEFMEALFGQAWMPAAPLLQIFCMVMPFQTVTALLEAPLSALGHAKTRLVNNLIALVIMPLAYLIGLQWGVIGLSLAWLIAYPIVWYLMLCRTLRVLGLEQGALFRSILVPLSVSALMLGAIVAVSPLLDALPIYLRLAAHIAIGATVYCGVMMLLFRERMQEAIQLIRSR